MARTESQYAFDPDVGWIGWSWSRSFTSLTCRLTYRPDVLYEMVLDPLLAVT
jgi:hypothetical protein